MSEATAGTGPGLQMLRRVAADALCELSFIASVVNTSAQVTCGSTFRSGRSTQVGPRKRARQNRGCTGRRQPREFSNRWALASLRKFPV